MARGRIKRNDRIKKVIVLDSRKNGDIRASRVEGIGDWVLQTDEFVNWHNGEDGVVSPVLLCYGDPGVGKTHVRYDMI